MLHATGSDVHQHLFGLAPPRFLGPASTVYDNYIRLIRQLNIVCTANAGL